MSKEHPERIAAAACLFLGEVHHVPRPGRHADVLRHMLESTGRTLAGSETQGFLTDRGRFVDRREAAKIALAAGQIPNAVDELFSENVW